MTQNHDKIDPNFSRSTISTTVGPAKSPIKGIPNYTSHTPTSPVLKPSFDLYLQKLLNLNNAKIRESGEWTVMVRVFFLTDKPLATSEPIAITACQAELQTKLTINLDLATYGDLDNLIHYPLVINFYEIEFITKDPKKKTPPEEKIELIGQSLVNLLPLVMGELESQQTLPVFLAVRPVDPEDKTGDQYVFIGGAQEEASLVVRLQSDGPIILEEYSKLYNIFSLTIYGCYQLPAAWLGLLPLANAHPPTANYAVVTSLPSTSDHDRFLLVTGKGIQAHVEPNQPSLKRWPSHPLFISKSNSMEQTVAECEKIFPKGNAMDRPCVMVNTEFRCILSRDAEEVLKARCAAKTFWPIEFFNVNVPEKHISIVKKKAAEASAPVEESLVTRHGVAYVDITNLVYPGKRIVADGIPIVPYEAAEFFEKTGRKSAGLQLFSAPTNNALNGELEKPVVGGSSKKNQDLHLTNLAPNPRKSLVPTLTPSQHDIIIVPPAYHTPQDEADRKMFVANQSFIMVKLELHQPLVKKQRRDGGATFTAEDILQPHLSSMLPNDNGLYAMQQYREEIKNCYEIAASLYNKEMKKSKNWVDIYESIEKEVFQSGQLCLLKDRLKRQILRIVRDRFYRVKPFEEKAEYQGFLSELYADLVREIHLTYLTPDDNTSNNLSNKAANNPSTHYRILALEAEIDEETLKAEQFLLQRIKENLVENQLPQLWMELGQFQLRHRKLPEAVDSFAESLLNDCLNLDSLLLLGYTFFEEDKPEETLTLFEAVCELSDSPVAWTALGIFYESLCHDTTGGFEVLKERAFYRANAALGHSDARMREYRIQQKDLERLCGAEVPDCVTGEKAVVESRKLIRKLLHPRVPTIKNLASDTSNAQISPNLFRPMQSLRFYDEQRKKKYHPKPPLNDNIFYYSLPYFSGWGLFRLANQCILKLNGVCETTDRVFWKSALMTWMERQRWLDAQKLVDELTLNREVSATYHTHRGVLAYIVKNSDLTTDSFDAALSADVQPWDRYAIYYRYGSLAQGRKEHGKSREMFQLATRLHGTSAGWLGCGVASFYLNDWFNAEYALTQASGLDGTDARIWAFLAMIAHRSDRTELAWKHFDTARQCGLSTEEDLFKEVEWYLKTHFRFK